MGNEAEPVKKVRSVNFPGKCFSADRLQSNFMVFKSSLRALPAHY